MPKEEVLNNRVAIPYPLPYLGTVAPAPPSVPYVDSDLGFSLVVFTDAQERRFEGEFGYLSMRLPDSNGSWQLGAYLAIQRGQLVIESVTIKPAISELRAMVNADDIPDMGITTDLLRLPLRQILGRALGKVFEAPGLYAPTDERIAEAARAAAVLATTPNEGRRRGNRELGDEMYVLTAEAYIRAVGAGAKDVTGAIASTLGVERSVADTRKREARKRGFLPRGTSGRSGGIPGPKLLEWWKERS